jgi:hypothetical protein
MYFIIPKNQLLNASQPTVQNRCSGVMTIAESAFRAFDAASREQRSRVMKAITKVLAAGAAIAAFAAAAPAAAQYYPGYGYPGYGYGNGGVVGAIINGVTGNYGYGYNGYGYNAPGGSQVAASQCSAAVQQRVGYGGYGYGVGYGQGVQVNSVELRSGGGYRVRGIVGTAAYGGALRFNCRTDPRGLVVDVDLGAGNRGYGYSYGNGYYGSNYADPYAAYGYHRY